jgi:uncharacterized protein (DUF488 family)
MPMKVYTVGHSTHHIETFLALLKSAGITAVVDVRSSPYSRLNPQFGKDSLKQSLAAEKIKYVFLGKELGARSSDSSVYRNGQVQYEILAETDLFKSGIERVKQGAEKYQVALMCAEKEPLDCHRTILVARKLEEHGICIMHILGSGVVESHQHVMERLVSKLQIPKEDMFRTRHAAIAEAYEKQASQIAYRKETDTSPSSDNSDKDRNLTAH